MDLNNDDLPSDSESDDEEYCPTKDKDTPLDESDIEVSDCEETYEDNEDNGKQTSGTKRKKATPTKSNPKKMNLSENIKESIAEAKELNSDEEKEKSDSLWAEFLSGTDDPTPSISTKKIIPVASITTKPKIVAPPVIQTDIFEFAGEKIEVKREIPKATPAQSSNSTAKAGGFSRNSGVGSILDQLTKKNKISVLEKTKLDWDGFKKDEGIQEDLKTHNQGRGGFLERRDFLERTDVRQFEIEKQLRQTKRSAR
ncbi:unnamed protein product [Diamesa hyperborea]